METVWFPYKKEILKLLKRYKKATKLIVYLKHLPYTESLNQLMLPALKYRYLHGDMIEVFKIVHDFYHLEAAVKLNFNILSRPITRGNTYKLHKSSCHYNIRKYSFSSRVVNMWNSLPNDVVEANTINT